MDIDDTLKERGAHHGRFEDNGITAQRLKDVVRSASAGGGQKHWDKLRYTQKEALDMILHKIARILSGDPNFHDHWHDIVGYAKLVADEILKDKSVVPDSAPPYRMFDADTGIESIRIVNENSALKRFTDR